VEGLGRSYVEAETILQLLCQIPALIRQCGGGSADHGVISHQFGIRSSFCPPYLEWDSTRGPPQNRRKWCRSAREYLVGVQCLVKSAAKTQRSERLREWLNEF
jgi:hypothetical protein